MISPKTSICATRLAALPEQERRAARTMELLALGEKVARKDRRQGLRVISDARVRHARPRTRSVTSATEQGADSVDHVIPQSYFLSPPPKDLLRLPAHFRCQSRKMEQSEQRLRALCSAFAAKGSSGEKIWNGPDKRYYERNTPAREETRISMLPYKLAGVPVIPVPPVCYRALEKIARVSITHTQVHSRDGADLIAK